MSILIISPNRDPQLWVQALKKHDPGVPVEVYPEVTHPEKVEFVLCWNHPHGVFSRFPNLKVIASMGAGIDHILSDPQLPPKVKITRIVDSQLTEDMSVFVLSLVLNHIRNLSFHHCSTTWNPKEYQRPEKTRIGIMGMGVLGRALAEKLLTNGFQVYGWRKEGAGVDGVHTFTGPAQLDPFLKYCDVLVCLLPLTSETEGLLSAELFQKLPKDAYLINVARGNHLVEKDLLDMISNGHLSGASLDVFREEPLPENHPFWMHKQIRITPHIASVTHPESVAPQVLENYRNLQNNRPLKHQVSRTNEY